MHIKIHWDFWLKIKLSEELHRLTTVFTAFAFAGRYLKHHATGIAAKIIFVPYKVSCQVRQIFPSFASIKWYICNQSSNVIWVESIYFTIILFMKNYIKSIMDRLNMYFKNHYYKKEKQSGETIPDLPY